MPMLPDNMTSLDQYNNANFENKIVSKNAYTGSKSFEAKCVSPEGGYSTFEWYQMDDAKTKHLYVRDGRNTDLMELYKAGKGLKLKDAEYLQFYVNNPSNYPLSIKWLSLYGEDYWSLKVAAKYVTYLVDGEWESLRVANETIPVPAKYTGFIRVALTKDNFKSGNWDGKSLKLDLITAVGAYLDSQNGQEGATFYIDDVAFVGKNLNAGMNTKVVKEDEYFKNFLGTTDDTPASKPVSSTTSSENKDTSSETNSSDAISSETTDSSDAISSETTSSTEQTTSSEAIESDISQAGNNASEDKGANTPIIIVVVIIIAAVVIAGVAALIIVKTKKK